MPIDKSRYPSNWKEIAFTIKQQANWCCVHCGKPCRKPGESIEELEDRLEDEWRNLLYQEREDKEFGTFSVFVPGRFVLTVAHIDQNPSNNTPNNLAALCSVCHLKHDLPYREYNRRTKRERNGQLNLFCRPEKHS